MVGAMVGALGGVLVLGPVGVILGPPVGAVVGYLILLPFMSDTVYGMLFASVAGIMVFISIDELLPAAQAYGEHHLSIYGLVAGMALMAISLLLFM
jgi:ZIP family zinc transporter